MVKDDKEKRMQTDRKAELLDSFGLRLKELRDKSGWTQSQLAKLSGVPQSTINHIEHRKYIPNWCWAVLLAETFGVSVAEFAPGGRGEPKTGGQVLAERIVREAAEAVGLEIREPKRRREKK